MNKILNIFKRFQSEVITNIVLNLYHHVISGLRRGVREICPILKT